MKLAKIVVAVCAIFTSVSILNAQTVFENFDVDPGWSQYGQPSGVIDFGYSGFTNWSGGNLGEGGGVLARFDIGHLGSPGAAGSYGVSLGQAFTLADPLVFSAKVYDSGATEPQFGFYTEGSMISSWIAPRSFMGYAPDIDGNAFLKLYTEGGNVSHKPNVSNIGAFELTFSYDPDMGDFGQMTANINGTETSVDISEAARNSGVEFTHFGLNVLGDSHASGFRAGEFYFDDVTYTGVGGTAPVLATRFAWTASGLGDWGSNNNWTPQGGVDIGDRANNPNHTAIFPSGIAEPTNVSIMNAVTLNRIEFDNSTNSYVVSGLGSINMASTTTPTPDTPTMSVTGSHRFQAAVNMLNETTVEVTSDSQMVFDGALSLGGTTLSKTGPGAMAVNNKISLGLGGQVDVLEGTLAGNGTLGGNVDNGGGTIAPGNSVGILTISGDLNNGAGGTVAIEIDGTDGAGEALGHDQIQVTGSSTLAGTLDITTGAYADPTVRATVDSFTLITAAGGSTGTFDTINYNGGALTASQGNGVFRNMIYDANNVTLENLVALEGDADGDKDIDITDFNILASNFDDAGANSATNDWTTADFDLDGDIDITDFNFLAANFADTGYGIVSPAGGQVPEPGTLALLLFGGLLGFWAWRRQPTN